MSDYRRGIELIIAMFLIAAAISAAVLSRRPKLAAVTLPAARDESSRMEPATTG
jgi:hypothetical protein